MLPARHQFRLTSQCAQLCQAGGTAHHHGAPAGRFYFCLKMLVVMSQTVLVLCSLVHCLQGNTVVTKPLTPRYLRQLRGVGIWRGEGVWRGGAEPGEEGHMPHSAGRGARQNWMQPSTPGASVCPGPAVGLVSPHQLPHPCSHTQDNLRHPGMPCPYLSWAGA